MDTKELLGRVCGSVSDNEICIYNCGDGTYMRLIKNASETDFIKICDECERLGYTLFQRNDIEENIHASYRGDMLIHTYFCPAEKILRVICDPYSVDFEREEPKYARRCGSALWQFENDHSYIDCGMCYILRCADNSFFIIDGGHFLQPNDHKRIYRFLRERTPDGERAVISGWFFSHAHDDHVSQFVDFIREYGSAVDIEKLYYNDAPIDHRDNMSWGEANKKYIRRFEDCARSCGIPTVKLHTGQRFFVRNLRFDVLCTQEDVWPKSLENFNNTSCALALEADGTRIIFPGDAADVESDIMTARYTAKNARLRYHAAVPPRTQRHIARVLSNGKRQDRDVPDNKDKVRRGISETGGEQSRLLDSRGIFHRLGRNGRIPPALQSRQRKSLSRRDL